MDTATVSYRNAYDTESPFGSMVGFIASEALQSQTIRLLLSEYLKVPPDTLLKAASAVEKMWAKKILAPFDGLVVKADKNAAEIFDGGWDYEKIRDAGTGSIFALAAAAG